MQEPPLNCTLLDTAPTDHTSNLFWDSAMSLDPSGSSSALPIAPGVLFSALGGLSSMLLYHAYQKSQRGGNGSEAMSVLPWPLFRYRNGAPSDQNDSSRLAFFTCCTGIENAERAVEVMDTMVPIFLGNTSEQVSITPILNWKSRLETKMTAVFLDVDAEFQDRKRFDTFVTQNVFCTVTSVLLGPTFPAEALHGAFTALFTACHTSKPQPYLWTTQARTFSATKEQVTLSLIRYLEEWWYLDGWHRSDGYGDIEGISGEVNTLLKIAKREELTLEETAAVLLFLLREIVASTWEAAAEFLMIRQGVGDEKKPRTMLIECFGPVVSPKS